MLRPLLACILVHGAALTAQNAGTIRGAVTDSVSGAPVIGARAAALESGRFGRVSTDSAGRYVLDHVPAGTWVVQLHCPSRTLLGRNLARRTVTVPARGDVVLDVRVPPGGCFEPDSSSRTGIFSGHYTAGFESSGFVPCHDASRGLADGLLPGQHLFEPSAWVTMSSTEQRQRIRWPKVRAGEAYPRFFVRLHGTLSGPGKYGHMGVSSHGLAVDSVIQVRRPRSGDCKQ